MSKENKNTKQAENKTSSNAPKGWISTKYIFLVVLLIIVGYFAYTTFIKDDVNESKNNTTVVDPKERIKNIKEPQFKKEGELEFYKKDNKTSKKKIDIELADNSQKRMQGMMYRKSMDEEHGMLFLFDKEEPQEFWMKNTIIPLDIIYVNSKKEIVKIFKNTTPFSEKPLPSEKPAKYVVEVNGGFTDKYEIKEGDLISFQNQ